MAVITLQSLLVTREQVVRRIFLI